jgi:formylglycine-generating enzyme required for sulfatase activity
MNSPEAGDPIGESVTLRALAAGQVVCDRYTLQRLLGRGGMGVVWLARDGELGEDVALKFLPDLVALDRVALDELRRETRRSRVLTHPHIVRVHDFVRDERTAAIVMEFVDGDTLAHLRLAQPNQVFEPAQLLPWIGQLAAALDYAHARVNVVHRDLKPANLMVDAHGDLKVADFGISATVSETVTRVSRTASGSGTPVYMSPQQMRGVAPAPADDIYAIGATLHELLTGRPPFFRGDIQWQVLSEAPRSIAERRAELGVQGGPIPAEWEAVIAACLAKEPAARPSTTGEVAERLVGRVSPRSGAPSASALDPEAATIVGPPVAAPRAREQAALVSGHPAGPSAPSPAPQSGDVAAAPDRKLRLATWLVAAALLGVGVAGGLTWRFATRGTEEQTSVAGPTKPVDTVDSAPSGTTAQPETPAPAPGDGRSTPEPAPTTAAPGASSPAPITSPPQLATTPAPTPQIPRKGQPWANSLGMKFVPVPGTDVLFCIWETRVQDYAAFGESSGHDAIGGMRSNRGDGWEVGYDSWKSPGFPQGPTHPVVGVSWDDAKAFCQWLSKSEQGDGWLTEKQWYRLARDWEWSVAVGLDEDRRGTPVEKSEKNEGIFPWGTKWPPPQGVSGNFADEAARRGRFKEWGVIFGYEDGFEFTAPVGSYPANRFGLHDLAGNLCEWVEDLTGDSWIQRTVRGSSFLDSAENALRSAYRGFTDPGERSDTNGFRIVCVVEPSEDEVSPWAEVVRDGVLIAPDAGSEPGTQAKPQPGQPWRIPGLEIAMNWVEPGSFTMGSPEGEAGRNEDEGPQTHVALTEGFWLGACEVTQGQGVALMGANPSTKKEAGAEAPVETLSWNDAAEFCRRLTEREQRAGRLPIGYVYALPTEAQWEYACRAGTTGPYAGTGDADEMAWTWGNSGDTSHPVGSKSANAWGFHDMHGNVWEFCSDWYVDHLPGGSVRDLRGPASGRERVFRGGCYANPADTARSARRASTEPDVRNGGVGLRVALVREPEVASGEP